MNTQMALIETPVSAGAEAMKQAGASQQSGSVKKEPLSFKKKLEDCIETDEAPYGVSAMAVDQAGGDTQDNSMAVNVTDSQVSSEIVGILEGFGLLDYQSNLPLISPQSSAVTEADEQASAQAADTLLQGLAQNAEQEGAMETYARMLSKDQLSQLPAELQQAISKAVGDYLGSFESTNNKQAQNAAAQDEAEGVQPVTLQAVGEAADISALPDKIASLLIKLKAAEAKPAEPVAVAADVTAGEQSDTDPATAEKPESTATVKADAKAPAASEAPGQRTDTVVQIQQAVSPLQDTEGAQTEAKAPETTSTDFVKDNVMRIVDKMSTQVNDGQYDFDVELKPDFLGKVNIRLSMQNGEIRMQIKTDDMSVKGMFTDQAATMQTALKDKGITVSNIDVTYQSQMQTGDNPSGQNGSGGKRRGSRPNLSLLMGSGAFEPVTDITGYTMSSIEYLA